MRTEGFRGALLATLVIVVLMIASMAFVISTTPVNAPSTISASPGATLSPTSAWANTSTEFTVTVTNDYMADNIDNVVLIASGFTQPTDLEPTTWNLSEITDGVRFDAIGDNVITPGSSETFVFLWTTPNIAGDYMISVLVSKEEVVYTAYENLGGFIVTIEGIQVLTPRAPIYIDGNAGFTLENGVNGGGSGTENDPYIIENYSINAENANGIEIRNTTAHFVIRNCYAYDGGENYNGIYLYLVENGKIENNTCKNNWIGIYLSFSSNNTLENNICENNTTYGICISSSSYNNLINNACLNNQTLIYSGYLDNNPLVKGSALDIDKIPNGWPTDAQNTTGPQPPAGYEKGALSQTLDYQVVISGVPAYLWYNGCGPTAAGMIIGYWNEHGFDDLVSGSTQEQTNAVNDMISSSGNYDDYCVPIDYYPYLLPDKSEPPVGDEHANNCVADFMKTSQSYYSNYYGWGWFSDVDDALRKYVQMVAPHYKVTVFNAYWGTFTWDSFCDEIDENHPVELLVDTNGDGSTDHFVTAMGYGEQDGTPMYACLNTWDNLIHWYEFAQMSSGQPWGIYGATLFSLEKSLISNGSGIYLFSSNNNIISNNTTSNNFFGIYLDYSFNNTTTNNTCGNNGEYGIYLLDSDNNRVYHNNFINNDSQAYDDGTNTWDNGYPSGGNYWSDYIGPDANGDGIGDTPYDNILGGSNQDNYPLMNPWPVPHLGTAVFSLVNLYTVNVEKNLYLENGSKLVVKFYTWGDAFENENVIEDFSPPLHVEGNESARHPGGIGVKKARLDLTTDDTGNVISTIASFTVRKVTLEIRFTEIPMWWAAAPPEGKVELEIEFMEIPSYWAGAPS